ncbi:MAG TPA: YciI family protein [Kofleriaceae bacterium]|nr:YciI family protein [Kofleriaceae bacterium]
MDDALAILMFRDEGLDPDAFRDDERGRAFFQKFVDWAADLDRRGKLLAVDPLLRGGKTVRRRGAAIVVDGPYAEGREAVLGYYLVRVRDLDEAVALAAESPHTQAGGATEVRMIGDFPRPPSVAR